jgi:cytoskeletal protein CcmA (bactofilin family)
MYKIRFIISAIVIFALFLGCDIKKIPTTDDGIEVDGKIASVTTDAGFKAALARTDLETINLSGTSFNGSYSVNSAVAINGSSGTSVNGLVINRSGVELDGFSANTVEVASGVGDGDCKIQNIAINDQFIINGGGANSVYLSGTSNVKGVMKVNKAGVSVKLSAQVSINKAVLTANCSLDQTGDTGEGKVTTIFINVASSGGAANMTIDVKTTNVNILQLPSDLSLNIDSTIDAITALADNDITLNITGFVGSLAAVNSDAIRGSVGGVDVTQLGPTDLSADILADAVSLLFDKLLGFSGVNSVDVKASGAFTLSNEYDRIYLPTSFKYLDNTIDISWNSGDNSVLSATTGVVTHDKNSDKFVTLTATVSVGDKSNSIPLVFSVKVAKAATTSATTTTTIPDDIDILGTWKIKNLNPKTGGQGDISASFDVSADGKLTIKYNGTTTFIGGDIVSYDNEQQYVICKINSDFTYNGSAINGLNMKISWEPSQAGEPVSGIYLTAYQPNVFRAKAAIENSVIWGPTPLWTKQ